MRFWLNNKERRRVFEDLVIYYSLSLIVLHIFNTRRRRFWERIWVKIYFSWALTRNKNLLWMLNFPLFNKSKRNSFGQTILNFGCLPGQKKKSTFLITYSADRERNYNGVRNVTGSQIYYRTRKICPRGERSISIYALHWKNSALRSPLAPENLPPPFPHPRLIGPAYYSNGICRMPYL